MSLENGQTSQPSLHARNVRLQRERKHADAAATRQNLTVDFVSLATLSSVRVVRGGSSSVNSSGSIEGRLSNIQEQQKIMLC